LGKSLTLLVNSAFVKDFRSFRVDLSNVGCIGL
jgi:hypothetical protein